MPTYSYRCQTCGNEFDELKPMADRKTHPCECGKTAKQRITPVHFDYAGMGTDPAFTTFADRFDRSHREQAKKEAKIHQAHGDYGPSPGS